MSEKVYYEVTFDENGNKSTNIKREIIKKPHLYPLGSLVEILKDEEDLLEKLGFGSTYEKYVGMRLFVSNQFHTESGEAMYDLSIDIDSHNKKMKVKELLNSNVLVYGSKEYLDKTRDYFIASGSEITHIKESMLKLIKV